MTKFKLIVECINNKKIGDTVSRQELIEYSTSGPVCYTSSTVDIYRRKLTLFGFLSDYDRGVYKKEQDIPSFLKSSMITKFSNNAISRYVKIKRLKDKLK